jgi:hypothetical protein
MNAMESGLARQAAPSNGGIRRAAQITHIAPQQKALAARNNRGAVFF